MSGSGREPGAADGLPQPGQETYLGDGLYGSK